jgi:hypothetical protein
MSRENVKIVREAPDWLRDVRARQDSNLRLLPPEDANRIRVEGRGSASQAGPGPF